VSERDHLAALIAEWRHARHEAARWKRRVGHLARRMKQAREARVLAMRQESAAVEAETLEKIADLLLE